MSLSNGPIKQVHIRRQTPYQNARAADPPPGQDLTTQREEPPLCRDHISQKDARDSQTRQGPIQGPISIR